MTKAAISSTVEKNRKADMIHALILNLAIIGLIIVALIVTGNPLALLGIVFLKEMPYGLIAPMDDEDPPGRPIGFVHADDD